ncbi:hypothetical protein S7711_07066 [Stachybotrys chartarum IBT 7711]|uniref:AB hydrolase-1 domain-containing protein n=1 Tax=Stachybotrys chartarum (strain CBS 109288 / IBT 7711) TaxID=1280523 RepID=A0A084AP62_STACB|nr:hypothetical protein S7711_07066 [Stachybotrys chartarum IBT 7711]KFA53885.1 hypothetical protein S40293_08252 [Stachybotrys chartarum IBT 40293]KFA74500.1 hypothetical protein S40288_07417 [Stachybotrys chartarum IBT 40288]
MDCPYFVADLEGGVRIAYADKCPDDNKGVIVLIHGFPQTSYQFRKVVDPFVSAGYRVIAPDYRGAGASSKPDTAYTKSAMAADILHLLEHLSIEEPVHVVGHDIGGMVAYAFASRYAHHTASVVWGECPLPGTLAHDQSRTTRGVEFFHFLFHSVPDLPEALVAGRERIYLNHFYTKLCCNAGAITPADVDYYARSYSEPGALRCGFDVYRTFLQDADENNDWISKNGKLRVRALGLNGRAGPFQTEAADMMAEVHEKGTYEVATVPDSGHWIAEENPEEFVRVILEFIGAKQQTG